MEITSKTKKLLIERDGLRCSITGEQVESPSDLSIEHVIPRSKGGSDDIDNLILVKREINMAIGDDDRRRTLLLIEELKKREAELNSRERESFDREQSYREQIEKQKAELEEFRYRLKREQAEREEMFEKELYEQRRRLDEQQSMLQEKLRQTETHLQMKLHEAEAVKMNLMEERQKNELKLAREYDELEKEKEKYREESRKKIETSSSDYVSEALKSLDTTARRYHNIARNWSIVGTLSLMFGIMTGLYFGVKGLTPLEGKNTIEWAQVVFFGFKGLIVIGLFIALAKYCFMYGQSFMHESLKNSERKHAINFGKFYLESYGADADWTQVKEAFEHWNIVAASAFSKNDPDKFDPKVFDKATQLINSLGKLKLPKNDIK